MKQTYKTKENVINWLKAAQKRQQEWQQDVKRRWAEKQQVQTLPYETF